MSNFIPPEKPKLPNTFQLELTPPKPVINPDIPLSMTVRNVTKEIQEVIVEVDSYLFKLEEARAEVWPKDQIYHKIKPGGTMSFQIGVVKKLVHLTQNGRSANMERLQKPEGWLKLHHKISKNMDDTDEYWGFKDDDEGYYIMPGRRIIYYCDPPSIGGYVEMELICEKETEWTKKFREELFKEEKPKPKKKCSVM